MCKTDLEKLRSVTVEDKLNYIRNIGIFVGIIQLGLRHGISGPSEDLGFHVRVLISYESYGIYYEVKSPSQVFYWYISNWKNIETFTKEWFLEFFLIKTPQENFLNQKSHFISSFTCGVAFHVVTSQLFHALGTCFERKVLQLPYYLVRQRMSST